MDLNLQKRPLSWKLCTYYYKQCWKTVWHILEWFTYYRSFNSHGKVIIYQRLQWFLILNFCSTNIREIRVLNYLIKFLKLLQPRTSCISVYVWIYTHTHRYTHILPRCDSDSKCGSYSIPNVWDLKYLIHPSCHYCLTGPCGYKHTPHVQHFFLPSKSS